MRSNKRSRSLKAIVRIAGLLGILGLALVQCKSPTSPEGKGEADITVINDSGETVDIYLDGEFKFTLKHKWSIEIDNVSLEQHELEARELNTGKVIDQETLDVEEKIDYSWTVGDPPDIKVINDYGKALAIYMDGDYQFDLAREESRWIIDVAYGERFLKAIDTSTGQEVASTSIKVDNNEDYSWTIEKIT
jgi:hypothetical protein